MDANLWAARVHAAKRNHAGQSHIDRHFSFDHLEGDDDFRADFTCPFCYEDFDIAALCYHLEDEHFFETKNTRRRRFRKGGMPSNSTLSLLGKELREGQLHSLFGGASSCVGAGSSSVPDPLLSCFVNSLSISETTEEQVNPSLSLEESSGKNSPDVQVMDSVESSLTAEEREQKFEEDVKRSEFVQQLLLSTILEC